MARVLLEHITKKYGDVLAVDDLNIEVRDKEFLVLVGPSGCGKSTALRMIAGLEDISSGSLYIGERVVNEVAPKDRDIAMVFQSYALYPHMTVFDNIAFGLRLRKDKDLSFLHTASTAGNGATMAANPRRLREAAIRARVEQVADGIGLREYLNRKPAQLSGGQRQRVALGRAIVREPQVFLMDEPLSNLDAKMRVSTRAELQRLHRRLGITTIYVTHDQVEAMTMGDRIAVMKNGILQQLDTPEVLYSRPANMFVATFIGSPAMNTVLADVQGGEGGMFLQASGVRLRVPEHYAQRLLACPGKQIYFGIRPEYIHDARYAHDMDPQNVADAHVDLVEPLGSDVQLYVSVENIQFVVRVDDRTFVSAGNTIKLAFDMEHMHGFEPGTERSLL